MIAVGPVAVLSSEKLLDTSAYSFGSIYFTTLPHTIGTGQHEAQLPKKDVQLQCWVPFACIAWHEHFRAPQTSNKGSQKTIGAWRPSPETSSEEGVLGEGFCAPIVFWKPLLEVWGAPFLISPPIYYPTHPPKLLFFLY